ncbi:SRPBCC family protein [Mucilaginibacter pedocola]|uniref:ATPase n=1 Tax=Mucilaginibacter pedocola TaxID=1792845 RepID=A0A1S9PCK7_9SPHI|nr:SRPBCC domain-containing protein [Mucilaginibacter pedocola]OOQ58716.1 ATPase [Mucilaginibacter pedocola]
MEQNKATATKEVWISHLCDAPREVVFKAWTNPEQLKQWYAPDGCTIDILHMDVRPGGTFQTCIHNPVYGDCWCKGEYLEVAEPEKLMFSIYITDPKGNRLEDSGKDEKWPGTIITTVTFKAIGNQCSFTLHQTVAEELARQTGAYQSWLQMFGNLDKIIA